MEDILNEIKSFKRDEKNKREYLERELENWKKLLLSEREKKEIFLKKYEDECLKVKELKIILQKIYKTLIPDEDREIIGVGPNSINGDKGYTSILPIVKRVKIENDLLREGTETIFNSIKKELSSTDEELSYDDEEETEIEEIMYEGVKYLNEKTLESRVYDEDGDLVGYLRDKKIVFLNSAWEKCHLNMRDKERM